MARKPYRTARQEHLADILDRLQLDGLLSWHWGYDQAASRAIYWIARTPEEPKRKLEIRPAEQLAADVCTQHHIPWLPVPQPGGEPERDETLRRIAQLQGTQVTVTADDTDDDTPPITPEAFDLSAYPHLSDRLLDQPGDDRSAQTFGAACSGMEHGLSDGHVKWFLAQYPPFLSKSSGRPDADHELDRVIHAARRSGPR